VRVITYIGSLVQIIIYYLSCKNAIIIFYTPVFFRIHENHIEGVGGFDGLAENHCKTLRKTHVGRFVGKIWSEQILSDMVFSSSKIFYFKLFPINARGKKLCHLAKKIIYDHCNSTVVLLSVVLSRLVLCGLVHS